MSGPLGSTRSKAQRKEPGYRAHAFWMKRVKSFWNKIGDDSGSSGAGLCARSDDKLRVAHPGNDHVVSGTEFPSARQHVIVLSAIPSQVLHTGLHISGVPVASVPVFVAYQVSEVSRSSNLISRVSRMKSRASIAAAP
jgi:hypothetical protein